MFLVLCLLLLDSFHYMREFFQPRSCARSFLLSSPSRISSLEKRTRGHGPRRACVCPFWSLKLGETCGRTGDLFQRVLLGRLSSSARQTPHLSEISAQKMRSLRQWNCIHVARESVLCARVHSIRRRLALAFRSCHLVEEPVSALPVAFLPLHQLQEIRGENPVVLL